MLAYSPIRSSIFLLLLFLPVTGCRNNSQLLETALRTREQDVQILREELSRLEYHNEALQREVFALRGAVAYPVTPEVSNQIFTLRRITIGRTTTGLDDDRYPGDEALQVVIEPRDGEDHIIKTPGILRITALQISPQGLKTPISAWEFSPEELRRKWKSGLFTTGYVVVMPWQQKPCYKNVRVIARMEMSDGRTYEADRDITVRLDPNCPPPVNMPAMPLNQSMPQLPQPLTPNSPTPQNQQQLPVPRTFEGNEENTGPMLQQTGHWRAPSLIGAIKLGRPEPVNQNESVYQPY